MIILIDGIPWILYRLGGGIIGARVLLKNWVARKPSNIYWNGIRTYHIFEQENMTIPDMVRLSILVRAQEKPEKLGNRRDDVKEGEKDDKDAGRGDAVRFFDLPLMENIDWRSSMKIALTENEAAFLRSKIEKPVPDSLLTYILKNNIELSKYNRFEMLYADIKDDVTEEMARSMKIACDFNRLVYTARVRYNMILSKGLNKDVVSEWEQIENNISWYINVDPEAVLNFLNRPDFRLRRFLFTLQLALKNGDIAKTDEISISYYVRKEFLMRGLNLNKMSFATD